MPRLVVLIAVLIAVAACASPSPSTVPDATASDATASDATAFDVMGGDGPPPLPTDTPPIFLDAVPLGEPPWVMLEVRTMTPCPPLTPCGGSVVGIWDVAGGCFDLPVPAELMRCPGAQVTRTSGRARGRVAFSPAVANRVAQWEVEAELAVPAICASFVGGCAGLQGLIRNALPDAACAAEGAAGDCRCALRQTGSLRDGDGYTTQNEQIVSSTARRRWNYCVTGDRLRYRDVTAMEPREPGTIELQRRSP